MKQDTLKYALNVIFVCILAIYAMVLYFQDFRQMYAFIVITIFIGMLHKWVGDE